MSRHISNNLYQISYNIHPYKYLPIILPYDINTLLLYCRRFEMIMSTVMFVKDLEAPRNFLYNRAS